MLLDGILTSHKLSNILGHSELNWLNFSVEVKLLLQTFFHVDLSLKSFLAAYATLLKLFFQITTRRKWGTD